MKKALITGISGQDGCYLAKFLLGKGYKVYGTSRDSELTEFNGLKNLGIKESVILLSLNLVDFRNVLQCLVMIKPDEIYNLASQSSVARSFEQPVETLESIATGTLNLLEAIRFMALPIKLYSAGSSECFGDTGIVRANEETPFKPQSPYAVAKATAFWEIANYRSAYSIFACTGILFNHESPLRSSRFVTSKIVQTACRIAAGSKERLKLGNINISRDWGWAPEYVEVMWLMLQQSSPKDYVIATGKNYHLTEFIELVFSSCGLDAKNYLDIDKSLFRPTDLKQGYADPSRAYNELGWYARVNLQEIVRRMVAVENKQMSIMDV